MSDVKPSDPIRQYSLRDPQRANAKIDKFANAQPLHIIKKMLESVEVPAREIELALNSRKIFNRPICVSRWVEAYARKITANQMNIYLTDLREENRTSVNLKTCLQLDRHMGRLHKAARRTAIKKAKSVACEL